MMPAGSSTIRVVIADDHDLVRYGIRSLLSQTDDIEVIGEVRDGIELLRLLESVQPDVVITDLDMPGMHGITAIGRLHEAHPDLKILVLTAHDSAEDVKMAAAAGASGYIRKGAPELELALAIRAVMNAGSYVGNGIAQRLLEVTEPRVEDLLTARQIEILTLLASGNSSKEIGFQLGLSSKTVDVHRSRIMARLNISDVASLTRYAVRKQLIKV